MVNESPKVPVSRTEFYLSLALIWMYILLLTGNQLNEKSSVSKYLLFGGAFFMTLVMSFQSFRLGRMARKPENS